MVPPGEHAPFLLSGNKNIKLSLALADRKCNLTFSGAHLQSREHPCPQQLPVLLTAQGYSPFFAGVSDSAPQSEVIPRDDSIFDGRRLSTEDKMTGRWRSVPAAQC